MKIVFKNYFCKNFYVVEYKQRNKNYKIANLNNNIIEKTKVII